MFLQIKRSKISIKQNNIPSVGGMGGVARRSVRNFELGNQAQGHTETRFHSISDTPGLVANTVYINVAFFTFGE